MKISNRIREAAQKFRNELNQLKSQQKSFDQVEVEPGQIWVVRFGDEGVFALTLSKPYDDGSEGVRIAPIFCSPVDECTCHLTDVVIDESVFPTKITSLIEWWNERPVAISQLKSFVGDISEKDFENVKTMLTKRPEPANNNTNLQLFRRQEIAIGGLISQEYLKTCLNY